MSARKARPKKSSGRPSSRRKDGAEAVFYQHMGPELFTAKEESLAFGARIVMTDFYVQKSTSYNNGLTSRKVIVSTPRMTGWWSR